MGACSVSSSYQQSTDLKLSGAENSDLLAYFQFSYEFDAHYMRNVILYALVKTLSSYSLLVLDLTHHPKQSNTRTIPSLLYRNRLNQQTG